MSECFLGIDNGGTLAKAVIFDGTGREIAGASRKLPLIQPQPGFTERDMEALWQSTVEVIREALAGSGLEPGMVRGIACTGHGKGLYLWGRDGKPACNGIVSTDARAWQYAERWEQDGTAARIFPKTMQAALACQPAALWRWLRDNNPGLLPGVRWAFAVKDYIRFRLTGEAWAEMTDYSGTGLMDLRTASFDPEVMEALGVADLADRLPPLRWATESCGRVTAAVAAATGLLEGTPVAAGMFDIDACALAMDLTDGERLGVIAGTWGVNEYVSSRPVLDGTVGKNSLFCIPGQYLIEESSPTSAGNNEWFTDLFLESERREAKDRGIGIHALAEEMAASVGPGDQSILFLPFLFGSNDNPKAKACLIGLESGHSRAQIIRAVLEGIVLSHRVHIDRLLASKDCPRVIRLAGGAANNRTWAGIFADVTGLPVEIVDTKELGTLGCAMAAAVCTGLYTDLKEAARHMVRVRERIEPDPGTKPAYDRKYRLFVGAARALDPLWKEY